MGERDESNLWVRLGDVYACCEVRVHTMWVTEGQRGWMAEVVPRAGAGETIRVSAETLREVLVKAVAAAEVAGLSGLQRAGEGARSRPAPRSGC